MTFVKNFWNEEMGQDMVEYALLLGFIAMAGVAVYSTISGNLKSIWDVTNTNVQSAADKANGK